MTASTSATGRRLPSAGTTLLAALPVLVIALNLRPALAAVGPVLPEIGADLGLSAAWLALLTAGPVFCMGLFAPLAPGLGRRLGLRRGAVVVLAAITAGLALRVLGGAPLLFAGTLVAAVGIAVGNVLVPALVREEHASRIGVLMGLYTVALSSSASLASATAAPLAHAFEWGWRAALGLWALPALVAVVYTAGRSRGSAGPRGAARLPAVRLRGSGLAWAVTAYMALQSLMFFTTLTWLAPILRERGASATTAGLLLSVLTLAQLPASLLVPVLAARLRSQWGLVVGSSALSAVGFAGLLLLPGQAAGLFVVVLGLGQGGGFALALTFIVVRTSAPTATASLSALAQTVGYTAAGVGPLAAGVLRDVTGGWSLALALLLAALAVQLLPAAVAARPGVVDAAAAP